MGVLHSDMNHCLKSTSDWTYLKNRKVGLSQAWAASQQINNHSPSPARMCSCTHPTCTVMVGFLSAANHVVMETKKQPDQERVTHPSFPPKR